MSDAYERNTDDEPCPSNDPHDPPPASLSAVERHAYEQLAILYVRRRAYAAIMGTRPQTLYAMADSPVGLAAWMLDHGDG
jgi:hypothetical protein